MVKDTYESPLSARYASEEMKYIFSPDKKIQNMEKTLDCSCRIGKRTRTPNYTGAD